MNIKNATKIAFLQYEAYKVYRLFELKQNILEWIILAEWIGALDSGSFVWEDADSNPSVPSYLVWHGSRWRDSVSLARVDPALNGYLEKSRKGKQEGCAKAQDGCPPPPHCTSRLKGQETEISTAGRDCKV